MVAPAAGARASRAHAPGVLAGDGLAPVRRCAAPGTAEDPAGVREGLGTPVLIVCSCSRQRGSAQHTGAAFARLAAQPGTASATYAAASFAQPMCRSRRRICVTLALMKVLVVGAGGVGAAFAAIAQRRPAFERVVLADVSPERVQGGRRRLGEPGRFSAERVDASERGRPRRADRPRAARRGAQRVRPALQRADLRCGVRGAGHLPGHGDDAVAPASRAPVRAAGRDARRASSSRATRRGSRPACWRSWGSASSRACPTCSPRYAADELFSRSTKSACATAPTSSSRAMTSRRRSRSGRRSRSA